MCVYCVCVVVCVSVCAVPCVYLCLCGGVCVCVMPKICPSDWISPSRNQSNQDQPAHTDRSLLMPDTGEIQNTEIQTYSPTNCTQKLKHRGPKQPDTKQKQVYRTAKQKTRKTITRNEEKTDK